MPQPARGGGYDVTSRILAGDPKLRDTALWRTRAIAKPPFALETRAVIPPDEAVVQAGGEPLLAPRQRRTDG